jgi:O-acetyl-ADP-ribose deacetylase (regulator of RNase III)
MGSIEIRKIGITKLDTDAVVNAANSGLWEGGGVCGYIFRDAGSEEMTAACQKIGHCDEGSAVITPGFKLPAKYVIHAVGPRWAGGDHNEPKLLYSAYKQSLIIAKENGLHSIGFPLISAGIFGYPVDKAWRKAIQACKDFQDANADYEMKIVFAVLDDQIKAEGEKTLQEIVGDKQNEEVIDDIKESAYRWCCKYEMLFQVIAVEDDLREYLKEFSVYEAPKEHLGIFPLLDECMHQAYEASVVVTNYREIIEENSLSERDLQRPFKEWTDTLTAEQILACIAWHFRRDHFSEGSWICDSVANGYMLTLVRSYMKAFEEKAGR